MLGSDEVHEDVVLHDAGLQARLGDRASGTPAQQHLTWGAVGRDCISQWSLGPLRTPSLSSHLFWGPKVVKFLVSSRDRQSQRSF